MLRRVLRRTWVLLAGGYGAAATLVLLATRVLGDHDRYLYAASLFAVWWLAPTVLLLPGAVLARTWLTAVVLVVPATTWLAAFGALLLPHPGAGGEADLRVATYNITAGTGAQQVLDLVAQDDVDVVLLQEVDEDARAVIEAQELGLPHRWYGEGNLEALGRGEVAVLSRYPITGVEPVTGLPAESRPTSLLTLDVDGRAVRVLDLHLASPCLLCAGRVASVWSAADPATALRVRAAEAERYAAVVEPLAAAGEAVVVAGDLNSGALNDVVPELVGAGLVDAQRVAGHGLGLTRGNRFAVARIDHVLVAGVRPVDVVVGQPGPSTHRPVVVDLAWED